MSSKRTTSNNTSIEELLKTLITKVEALEKENNALRNELRNLKGETINNFDNDENKERNSVWYKQRSIYKRKIKRICYKMRCKIS
jgi:uncharacterized protein (UPF0335 family)